MSRRPSGYLAGSQTCCDCRIAAIQPRSASIPRIESANRCDNRDKNKDLPYPIVIVDIRADLILLIFLSRGFWIDLAIRRNEPVSRCLALAINVGDIPFQGADFGQLGAISGEELEDARWECSQSQRTSSPNHGALRRHSGTAGPARPLTTWRGERVARKDRLPGKRHGGGR